MSQPRPADAIDPGFVATARTDVVGVEMDGEIVLYDDSRGVLHRLNPTAAALWQCLDGQGTLAEIAADMAEIFGVEPGRVLADVVATARQFGEQGLLVGVGEPVDRNGSALDKEGEQSTPFGLEARDPCTSCSGAKLITVNPEFLAVKAGPYVLGLQVTTQEVIDAARAVLRPALAEGIKAPPNVSILPSDRKFGRVQYYCYRSDQLVARTRSLRRALEIAISLLESCGTGSGALGRLPALLAVRDGRAALLDPMCEIVADRLRHRLRKTGWALADAAGVDLDPAFGEVVVSLPSIAFDPAALGALPPDPEAGERPRPGRYAVAACVYVASGDRTHATTAARVVTVASGFASMDEETATKMLRATAAVVDGAAWRDIPVLDVVGVVRALTAAAG